MSIEQIIIGVFAVVNLFAFFVIGADKRKAIRGNGQKRAPEGLLFFLATCFGSLGVYAGMLIFRHKTKKWYFQLGIPLLILQNLATIYIAYVLLDW